MTYKFTIIIMQEGKWHVARCVELGVVSQGKTIEQAQKNLKEAVELYLEDQPERKKYFPKRAPLVTTLEISHA
ncbi:type II toxin-antitoxin system HicB family antitoxin [Patescibacteria group bacterium AH-259-L07]|nr:type II toxin-antitoxin system HicB family antitoxin [Patescibacteria group bacterium AH-259-L07]